MKNIISKKTRVMLNAIFAITAIFFYSTKVNAQSKIDCDEYNKVCVILDVKPDYVKLSLLNKTFANKSVKLNLTTENINFSNKIPEFVQLKPREQLAISNLTPANPNLPINLNYTYKYSLGRIDAKPDDFIYGLPFSSEQNFKLIQAFGGNFTHNKPLTKYALDYRMPEGTKILAAREGRVIEVVEKFNKGGKDESLRYKANYVYIEHQDGTIGAYLHIKQNGALVKEGDYITKGQAIALSGFTGYADVPHLHFSVIKSTINAATKDIDLISTEFEYLKQ